MAFRVLIFTALTTPIFDEMECPYCDYTISRVDHFAEHLTQAHLSISLTDLVNSLAPNNGKCHHDLCELSISLWEFIWGF